MSNPLQKTILRPVLPLLAGWLIGAGCGIQLPGYRWPLLILAIILLTVLAVQIIRKRSTVFVPCILFLMLGYLSIQPWVSPDFPTDHVIHFADDDKWDITGKVISTPYYRVNRIRFTIEIYRLRREGINAPARGKLRITAIGAPLPLHSGDRLLLHGKIRTVRSFKNPGGFDYRQYLAFQGIWATAYVGTDQMQIIGAAKPGGLQKMIDAARERIGGLIERTHPGNHRAVLKALLLGQRDGIDPALRRMFNRLGIGHLLAISGLHIGIVASTAFFLLVFLLKFSEPLLQRGWVRQIAAVISLFPVFFYAVLAGMSPSTQRAFIMVAVFMIGLVIYRDQDIFTTLAVAGFIILAGHPPALYSISFQLSFTAVLAILCGVSVFGSSTKDSHRASFAVKLRQRAWMFFIVSIFAQLGTLPLVMRTFNLVSLVSLPANLILVPLIGFITVPLGLLAVFISFVNSAAALWLLQINAHLLDTLLVGIEWVSQLSFAALNTFTPNLLEIVCFYLLFGSMLFWVHLRSARAPGTGSRSTPNENNSSSAVRFPIKMAAGFCLLSALVLVADSAYWIYQRFWRSDLRVTVIDVGQGTASLLELPEGYTILIDGGGFSDNSIFDVGARVIAPLLWHRKIMSVDMIILSHANSDHLNGLIYVAEHFDVQTIWTNGQPRPNAGYRQLISVIERQGIKHPSYQELARSHTINGVTVQILYPPRDYLARSESEKWRNTNNNSMVVRTRFGEVSILFPGDIMARAEKELRHLQNQSMNSQVLMAAHHGSNTSNTDALIGAVRPEVIVISCGWKNRYGFPHSDVMKRFKRTTNHIFRTDRHGAVVLTTDGRSMNIKAAAKGGSAKNIDFSPI